ncbi:MAG: hypothetical protein ACE5NL_01295 [Candidatus Hydrothermarchaeaceae archaeon]
MTQVEIVRRRGKGGVGETVYLRKRPWGRTVEEASKNRLDAMLTFAQAAWDKYGGKYEDIPEGIREAFRRRAPKREVKERTITLTPSEYIDLRRQMLRRGIGRLMLPVGYRIEIEVKVPPKKEVVVGGGGTIQTPVGGEEEAEEEKSIQTE